jgi:alpha-beta hydrolase superfamily lysophospholipase
MTDSSFPGRSGNIHTRTWELEAPRNLVVLVHGYGEHIGRYEYVAEALNQAGSAVYGLDHIGHGRSEGEPVMIPDFQPVVDDVQDVLEQAAEDHPGVPIVVVGHSMGGTIAVRHAQCYPGRTAGLVLSGPVLGNPSGIGSLLAAEVIPTDPLDSSTLSRDPAVGAAYDADLLVWHGPYKRRTLAGWLRCLVDIALDSAKVTGPVLWQHGADDRLVSLAETRRGIEALVGAEVTEKIYPDAKHEIFNETNKDEVLADTVAFLQKAAA